MPGLHRIISGGQTGVDRAALDSAISSRIYSWGGWVPKGRLAEDGEISGRYFSPDRNGCGLQEMSSSRYAARTIKNIADSDATLILRFRGGGRVLGPGTKLTIRSLQKADKPYILMDPSRKGGSLRVAQWICEMQISSGEVDRLIEVLNIAGPRESGSPGIYEQSKRFLDDVFGFVFKYQRWDIKLWSLVKPKNR